MSSNGKGSRTVKKTDPEAKRIDETHGFSKMQAERAKRDKDRAQKNQQRQPAANSDGSES